MQLVSAKTGAHLHLPTPVASWDSAFVALEALRILNWGDEKNRKTRAELLGS